MKYAKFSDDFLSDFRLDDGGETLVLTDKRGYTRAVKLLPYEEKPQSKWVPVSERLPSYSGLYLVSIDDAVTVATFTGTYFMHRGGWIEVDAWQPLPESYKEN